MQKILVLALSVILLISFVACGNKKEDDMANITTTRGETATTEVTEENTDSLLDKATSVAEDIKDDIMGDDTTSASAVEQTED